MDTLADLSPDFLCTDVSVAMDEALYGTAVYATTWFLLEYRGGWEPKAPADNDFPAHIQAWLDAQMEAVPNGRLQFIRQGKQRSGPLAFYIAITTEKNPRLYRFEIEDYDALLQIDVTAVLAGHESIVQHQTNEPLVLVCTHGRRDRCCALLGLPILNGLREALGTAVWQTTHLGGHRFAPTLLTLPHGVCYGRVLSDDVPLLIDGIQNGTMLNEKVRGRVCFQAVEQVADYVLRHETGNHALQAFVHHQTEHLTANQWQISFLEPANQQKHILLIEQDDEPLRLYASSGSYKLKEVPQFIFVSHEIELASAM